jgi:hypothetical protein
MTKFVMNKDFTDAKEVEASSYHLDKGYWLFVDEYGENLYTVDEKNVQTIERA